MAASCPECSSPRPECRLSALSFLIASRSHARPHKYPCHGEGPAPTGRSSGVLLCRSGSPKQLGPTIPGKQCRSLMLHTRDLSLTAYVSFGQVNKPTPDSGLNPSMFCGPAVWTTLSYALVGPKWLHSWLGQQTGLQHVYIVQQSSPGFATW